VLVLVLLLPKLLLLALAPPLKLQLPALGCGLSVRMASARAAHPTRPSR
jgi:hypothetical protein